ncbi:MAG: response regulator [Spirochaetia bacterium]
MKMTDPEYKNLKAQLASSEAIISALKKNEVDAVIGERSVSVVRLKEVEEELMKAKQLAEDQAAKLRESEARFRALADGTPVSIWVTDKEGKLCFVNKACAEYFRLKADSLGSVTSEDFIHPDDKDQFIESWKNVFTKKEPCVLTARLKRADGLYCWIESRLQPRFSENCEFLGFAGSSIDVTEKKLAQEALQKEQGNLRQLLDKQTEDLRRKKAQLAAAVDASGGGIYEHSVPIGPELFVSRRYAEILGYAPEEMPHWKEYKNWIQEHVHPDDKEQLLSSYNKFISGETESYEVELRFKHKRGEWIYVQSFSKALERDTDGRVTHLVGIMQDITKRKEMEQQILNAQKMEAVGQLSGGIAHDFNNMLQIITGYSAKLARQLPEGSDLQTEVKHIKNAARSAAYLTKQLLAFSRKQILRNQVISLNKTLKRIVSMLTHSLREDVQIHAELLASPDRVKVDPVQIEQVFMNMAVNAQKAMPHGGNLVFRTEKVELEEDHPDKKDSVPKGDYIMVSVSDTGCGMDSDTLEKIFDPFFTTRSGGQGTGLGLSSAYGIVRQSGGIIRCYSQPGEGTTFKIYLPVTEGKAKKNQKHEEVLYPIITGKSVLIVEDNIHARQFTAEELEELDYTVYQAGTLSQAEEIFEENTIDLVISDIVLPGEDGVEVYKSLTEKKPELAFLFMTGYDLDQSLKEHELIERENLLSKPFTTEELAQYVYNALSEKYEQKEEGVLSQKTGKKVLLIDDDQVAAEGLSFLLEDEGFMVERARTGKEALKKAVEFTPNFVVTDIKLPDINGYTLAEKLKQSLPGVKIIGCSGFQEDDERSQAFDKFFIKPIDLKEFQKVFSKDI